MKVFVVSPNYNFLNVVKKSIHSSDWKIIHIGDIDSLNYLLKDTTVLDGIIWDLQYLNVEHLYYIKGLLKIFQNIPIYILTQNIVDENIVAHLSTIATVFQRTENSKQLHSSLRAFFEHLLNKKDNYTAAVSDTIEIYPGILLNTDMHYLLNNGKITLLPGKEYELIIFLLKNRHHFVTIDQILLSIWDEYTTPETARQYIYKLRRKLEHDSQKINILIHCKGIGYILIDKNTDFLMKSIVNS